MGTPPNISHILPLSHTMLQNAQQGKGGAQVVESDGTLSQYVEITLFNPAQQAQRFRELDKFKTPQQKEAAEHPEEKVIVGVEGADEMANQFQQQNPELNQRTLVILRAMIKATDTPEEMLAKVLSVYPDAALADEAFEFLLATASPETAENLQKAKDLLNQGYERQIKSGRNIGAQARAFSKEGLGNPSSLRDMYRDITGTPREPLKLFDELSDKYPYKKLSTVISFLLHSLGSDLKAKGPSIDRGELARLLAETRSLQGMLGIFRFFQLRSRLIARQFQSFQLPLPGRLNFETLAKLFIKLLAERYVNPEKILQTAKFLGIDEEEAAQIIVYSQMHDALKQVAPGYYRSPQHRDELTKTFVETLEKLEKNLEEKKQKKKDQQRKKKKKKEDSNE